MAGGAEAKSSRSVGGVLLRILIVLTQSRAAVTQALDWGKTIRIAPSSVSRAKRTAIEMVASWLWSHCSLGGAALLLLLLLLLLLWAGTGQAPQQLPHLHLLLSRPERASQRGGHPPLVRTRFPNLKD